MDKLGLVFFPAFDWAIAPTHPERQERLLYTRDQILEEGLLDFPGIREYKPRLAEYADLVRTHIAPGGIENLVEPAHLAAAGGAIAAAEAVVKRQVKRSFALIRPPGHHAMRMVWGTRGFCTINMEAVMIEYLRRHYGIGRVAIVDTDVHHGDGTQDIYYHDPDTLFISFHQDGRTLYPGTGFMEEWGSPNALATTVNIPLPPGTGDRGLHAVLDGLVLPMLADYQPDLIINSAGQDNHYSDPLAGMAVTAQGYARMAHKLQADIAVLEGGYSLEAALPYVNVGIVLAMADMDYRQVVEPDLASCPVQQPEVDAYIAKLIDEWREIWSIRNSLRHEAQAKAGDIWQRKRNIYYDDSGIYDKQQETVRICRQCSGYHTISSQAGRGRLQSAFAAVIPRHACRNCRRQAGEAAWAAKRQGIYNYCFLQDQGQDVYEQF